MWTLQERRRGVADMLDKYSHVAQSSGALIVPMSGYDSIPSDLGVLFAVRAVRERFGQPTRRCRTVAEMGGALSGGTFATGIEMARDFPEHYKMQDDPFCMGGGTVPRAEDEDGDLQLRAPPHECVAKQAAELQQTSCCVIWICQFQSHGTVGD